MSSSCFGGGMVQVVVVVVEASGNGFWFCVLCCAVTSDRCERVNYRPKPTKKLQGRARETRGDLKQQQ